jgi:hypothetical protein
MERLAAARPPGLEAADEDRRRRDLTRILAGGIERPAAAAARGGHRARRVPPALPAGLALAAAVAVAAAVVLPGRGSPSGGARSDRRTGGVPAITAATDTPVGLLAVSADRLLAAPEKPTGQYWYERTRIRVPAVVNAYLPANGQVENPYEVVAEWSNETWIPRGDGVMHALEFQDQAFTIPDKRARARYEAAGSPRLNVLQDGVGGASSTPTDGLDLGIPYEEFLALEPDAAALAARIQALVVKEYPPGGQLVPEAEGGGKPLPGQKVVQRLRPLDPAERDRRIAGATFGTVTTWLRYSQQRPALQAALYEVLGGIPGVRYAGTVTDAAGRRGEAVALRYEPGDGSATESLIVVDRKTGRLLGELERVVSASPRAAGARAQRAGTVNWSLAYLDGRFTGRPAGGWPENPPGLTEPKG